MLTLEEYKQLLSDQLKGMTDKEIQMWYECHTAFISFILKNWSEKKREEK